MKTLVEFEFMSEESDLIDKANYFIENIKNCRIEYIKRGEHRKIENNKETILPAKNSVLYVKCENDDYNKTIIEMLNIYDGLKDYFDKIQCDAFINLSFFERSEYYFSLEFNEDVLALLSKYHFPLPISCYRIE